jgi:hypothetical protein
VKGAVEAGDYARFRKATYPYEESLRKRVGRWVGHYSEVQEKIGNDLAINDVVEAVFLNAFERYGERPRNIRLGQWMEGLIDGSVRALLQNPDEALENVGFARTLRDLAKERLKA